MKAVLITTEWRGVFFARVADDADLTQRTLQNVVDAKMAIRFGTTKGVMELCDTGPTSESRISAKADLPAIHGVTAVFLVTKKAEIAWDAK